MAPQYKVTYFAIRGIGEPIRFLLSYMGADFEDHRIEFSEWPQLKSTTPFGKLPLFEVNGKLVNQSVAISRYLGKQAGLAGANDLEDLLIDAAVDTVRDLIQEFANIFRETDSARKEKLEATLKNELLPDQLAKIDALLKENGGYLANGKLSWGDIYFAAIFDFLGEKVDLNISKYPSVSSLFEKVYSIPSIKSWIEKRPQDKQRA